ncbi:hypothetical protein [Paenibacillus sp. TC-CSREp1]|uniref:hypothetical protein n=1 Tax=Paenibacillus sp. TC-CSREp1 TaxID=3410089 RepID=UPI003CF679AC
MSIRDYVTRRREFASRRAEQVKAAHGITPNQTHNYFGGHSLGYWEGRVAALDDVLYEIEQISAEDNNEVQRLRAVLERFDDRKHAMMPRSQMARIAKEALDASS